MTPENKNASTELLIAFSPFRQALVSVVASDLVVLREVSEGWYVEYKSDVIPNKDLARHICAFANQFGGWLFIGVSEIDGKAKAFPGIPAEDARRLSQQLKNVIRDTVQPTPYFQVHTVVGPDENTGLAADRAIFIIAIPQGRYAPYVHADGRIYRRLADSSDPKPETSYAGLDTLRRRAEEAKEEIRSICERRVRLDTVEVSPAFVHLSIISLPLVGHSGVAQIGFDTFASLMRQELLPFDVISSSAQGMVARHVFDNRYNSQSFAWEFASGERSFVSIPICKISGQVKSVCSGLDGYKHVAAFRKFLSEKTLSDLSVVDLNQLFTIFGRVARRHRELMEANGVSGPYYFKARIQNVWRCLPFLDTSAFIEFINSYGAPVVQEDEILAPPGDTEETFVELPSRDNVEEGQHWDIVEVRDGATISVPIFGSLGIPYFVLEESASELYELAGRALLAQKERGRLKK